MRILYTTFATKSGSHIHYQRLARAMQQVNAKTETRFYPNRGIEELAPVVVKPFLRDCKEFDIIHSNADCGYVFKVKSKPFVVTVNHEIKHPREEFYCSFAQRAYHTLLLQYIKKALDAADIVIAVSNQTKQTIQAFFSASNIQAIYNGIDTNLFKPMKVVDPFPGKIKLLFVGNLTKRKGMALLPQIMERLDDRFVLLYTVGMRTKSKMVSNKRMIPIPRFIPESREHTSLYNSCDIFLFPSYSEGLGNVLLEAMACGKPVVTTNCSSMPEVIDDRKGGFLCRMNNVKDFGNKIKILAADKELRTQMGKYNRRKAVEKFSILKMAQKYKKVYAKLIK